MLSSDCSQIGTGSSNPTRSANQSSIFSFLWREARRLFREQALDLKIVTLVAVMSEPFA
jgi:hypothetical protein